MKSGQKSVLILTAGVALGLAVSSAIHAQQAKVPAGYLIAEVNVTDPATFKGYASQVQGTFTPFGGKYLVRAGKVTPLEGDSPTGNVVVIAFDSVQKALDWENSPAYLAIKPIRQKSAKTRNFIVEGVTPQ
jgi:uncharacterized protein (DUF1330 family)